MVSIVAMLGSALSGFKLPNVNDVKEKALQDIQKALRSIADSNSARKAIQLVTRIIYKSIGAVGHPNTGLSPAQRKAAIRQHAANIARQIDGLRTAVLAYAEAQCNREDARGGANDAAAVAAREAAEREMDQDGLDIVRACLGQDAHAGDDDAESSDEPETP